MLIKKNILAGKIRLTLALGLTLVSLLIQGFYPLYSLSNQTSSSLLSQTITSTGIFCSSGFVSCTNGLQASCNDSSYKPTCLQGFPVNVIDCCKNNVISLDCKSELPLCKVSTSSSSSSTSSSSGSVNAGTYCLNDMAYCSSGSLATCSDLSYTPKCLPGFPSGIIECCKSNGVSLNCRPDLSLTCPVTNSSSQNKFQTINIDVVSNPKLPDIIEVPLATDAFVNRSGFAYVGSNPSFEIKLPTGNPNTTISTIDLKDSSGFIFNDVTFTVTPISGQPEKFILSLSIPDSIKTGEARFALNLSDGSFLSGVIYFFNPLEISVFKGKGIKTKQISKPVVTRFSVNKTKNKITLDIRGNNFVGRAFLFKDSNNEDNFIENPPGMPNSTITIFPSSLKVEVKKVLILNNRTELKVIFNLPFDLDKKIDAVIVISTPSGIASRLFTLKPDFSVPVSQIAQTPGEAFCSGDKVVCSNGLKAFCTNSDYSPKCLAGFPQKTPDCCKKDNRSLNCKSFLLHCSSQ